MIENNSKWGIQVKYINDDWRNGNWGRVESTISANDNQLETLLIDLINELRRSASNDHNATIHISRLFDK